MTDPRHGNPQPWQQPQPYQPYQAEGATQPQPVFPPPYGQPPSGLPPYQPVVVAPPKRPNHILHLILTLLTCGFWSSVWITLTARYWNVVDYRNPAERPGMNRRTASTITALAALSVVSGVVIGVASAPGTTSDVTVTSSEASTEAPAAIDTTGPTPGLTVFPTPSVRTKPKATTTVAQREAIDSARSYLETGAFSRAGLISQLTSKYGEGFKKADATYAINHIKVDWNAEAVESAKSYLDTGGFSRASLIQQLSSSYGEQFTHAQAVYAANKVGL